MRILKTHFLILWFFDKSHCFKYQISTCIFLCDIMCYMRYLFHFKILGDLKQRE